MSLEDRIRVLKALLKDPDEEVRRAAKESLEKLESQSTLSRLEQLILNGSKHDKMRAIFSVMEYGGPEAVPLLALALTDEDPEVRTAAVRGLGDIGDPRSYDDVLEMLKDPDINVRTEAIVAIGKFRKREALPSLLPLLKVKNKQILVATIEAIGLIGDPLTEKALVAFTKHADPEVRATAARALGNLKAS